MKLITNMNNQKRKSTIFKSLSLLLTILFLCSSHDLYIKMETYFLQPNKTAQLSLYNGTFERSENIITRDRMLDASFVAHGKRTAIDSTEWKDQDSTITKLTFNTGKAGTYVAGVSTKARNIELSAQKFNDYLKHDGVLDMLEKRTQEGELEQDAIESYQKHVKAIFQVGDEKTDDWKAKLDYPIEFVPLTNPYESYSGDSIKVKLLLEGQPISNQLVIADYIRAANSHSQQDHTHTNEEMGEHSHANDQNNHSHESNAEEGHSHEHSDGDSQHTHPHKKQEEESHSHDSGQQLRTNEQGIITVKLPEEGIYYLRTIHMTKVNDSDNLTHRSKWATLTFEVSHKHDATTHTHEEEESLPTWIFIVGSLLLIGILFFAFRKK